MADSFDLKTKVERAVFALIVGTGTGNSNNTFPGEATSQDRALPNTTIDAGEGIEADLQPGNFTFHTGKIIFHDDAVIQPGNPNPNGPFLAAQNRVSAIITQLVQSDDLTTQDYTRRQLNTFGRALAVAVDPNDPKSVQLAANNQDMPDFTLLYWRVTDYGTPKKEENVTFYERVVLFECAACNSNID
jgi:hypothetical protein